ncbi:MAG: Spy/CpxP family protein refolding chaperone [Proteobacteria bacterium]|nr:Spy/CpxP family protein refolding chaperone [Pseudomonadota bacterium]
MKSWIKTSLVTALAATTLLGGAALAQGWGGGGGYGWRNADPELVKERMSQRVEVHLARLELALALTSEQKPAWADFKKAAEARAEVMLKEMENRRNAGVPKTAIERLNRAEEFSKKRAAMLADMRKSVEVFYGKLNAAQKTVFDAETAGFMQPMRGGGWMGGGCGAGMQGYGPGCMAGEPGACYDNFGRGGRRGKR